MSVTWSDLVQIAASIGKVKTKVVCNRQSGYTLLPLKMEVVEEIDGCYPPEQIIVDKIGIYKTAEYRQVEIMLHRIYSSVVPNHVGIANVGLVKGFPSNKGLVF